MKNFFKKATALLLVVCAIFTMVGCDKYKYNYDDNIFKFQYDEDKLVVTFCDNENYDDVFIHTSDGFYAAYVNLSILSQNCGTPEEILNNMQKYFVSSVEKGIVTNEDTKTSTGEYNGVETSIYEYNYSIKNDDTIQIVKSRVESVGVHHFVAIERYYEYVYGNDVIEALDLTYESATFNLN